MILDNFSKKHRKKIDYFFSFFLHILLFSIFVLFLFSENVYANTQEKQSDEKLIPYQDVPVLISAPNSSISGRPFIVIYRFKKPVSGFNKSTIDVKEGNITYFAGNKTKNIFRALVVPNPEVYKSDTPIVSLSLQSNANGQITNDIRILEPTIDDTNVFPSKLKTRLLVQGIVSRGGDSINTSDDQIGNTTGFLFGISLPIPETNTSLGQIIPNGNIRIQAGVEGFKTGSTGDENQTTFSTSTADILYEMILTKKSSLIGGLTASLSPFLETQNLQLKDVEGEYDAEVEIDNAFGFKLLLEYVPFGSINGRGFFLQGGFVFLDYLPSRIIVKNTTDTDAFPSTPSRIGATSMKLGFGYSY